MIKVIRSLGCAVLAALMMLSVQPAYAADDGKDFCWKDSYGRGVGTVPKKCARGYQRIGLLCYRNCPRGMKRFGFDCHSVCPKGFRNDGLFCRKAEYGRGAGYPWKFGDALNDKGMKSRCEKKHGRGKCEKNGAIFYPKCKSGYKNVGCCICRPSRPNCRALGLNNGIDLSCAKRVQIGAPKPGICGSGQVRDAGLCYKKCRVGFDGVGPVCWGKPPSRWVQCGMGAAKNSKTCGSIVFSQVSSVGQMAAFAATLGSSGAATSGANAATKAGKLAKLKAQFEKMKKAFEAAKNGAKMKKAIAAAKAAGKIKKGYNASQTLSKAVTEEDMVRAAAEIAAIADPSGVASTVAAYTYPKCSKYFPGQGLDGKKTSASKPTPRPAPTRTVSRGKPGKLTWVKSTGRLPGNAFYGGSERGRRLAVCSASYKGGWHPGKVVSGKCNIGWGGKEQVVRSFQVLTTKGARFAWSNNRRAGNQVAGGRERGRNLYICRASYRGGIHPGKTVSGKCNIGWGGKEISLSKYEVLTRR